MDGKAFLEDALLTLRKYQTLGEKAFAPLTDEEFFRRLDPESNSVAIIVKHMAGNMRSRWSDFLTTDGEKPTRQRDAEFEEAAGETRADVLAQWREGWSRVFSAIEPLSDADLSRTVTIRGEPHSVLQAIHRQVAHYASHVGQIIFLAKHLAGPRWKSLSIPRGQSREFDVDKKGEPYRTSGR